MAPQLETTLRGPEAYGLARRVIEAMETAGVWPTPLNFEIWVHYLGDPDGALGREIKRILAASEPFTPGKTRSGRWPLIRPTAS